MTILQLRLFFQLSERKYGIRSVDYPTINQDNGYEESLTAECRYASFRGSKRTGAAFLDGVPTSDRSGPACRGGMYFHRYMEYTYLGNKV